VLIFHSNKFLTFCNSFFQSDSDCDVSSNDEAAAATFNHSALDKAPIHFICCIHSRNCFHSN
jgi:hypothetical protein